MDRAEYDAFVDALIGGEKTDFKEWEGTPYFDGCLPIEIMAERGRETLRHGPMKPVGLTNPRNPTVKPYAIVQLRQDNALGTLYNIVGFQTKLKYGEQAKVLRMIPGLQNAEFARLGGLHRNTYLNSPRLLDPTLQLSALPRLRFAGQITGCEGYVESAAIGLATGRFTASEAMGNTLPPFPPTTALGALINHITGGHIETIDAGPPSFQPMNVNFGLFPPVAFDKNDANGKRLKGTEKSVARKRALTARAAIDMDEWITNAAEKS
jgi:methylenetetrahydrofolate--tRNA-(uracil-5-)-methyltransferase